MSIFIGRGGLCGPNNQRWWKEDLPLTWYSGSRWLLTHLSFGLYTMSATRTTIHSIHAINSSRFSGRRTPWNTESQISANPIDSIRLGILIYVFPSRYGLMPWACYLSFGNVSKSNGRLFHGLSYVVALKRLQRQRNSTMRWASQPGNNDIWANRWYSTTIDLIDRKWADHACWLALVQM